MKTHYLVYLPSLTVTVSSRDKNECDKAYQNVGRDYNEDYKVMTAEEFIQLIKSS